MPGTPGTPITAITATPVSNNDLPAGVFPSVERITIVDRVGPSPGGANRQDTAHEKRTETLRTTVNLLVAAMNVIDSDYMRRDGTTQADSTAGFEANIPVNGHIFTNMGNGTVSTDSCAFGQIAIAISALLSTGTNAWTNTNVFSGVISVPTQAVGDNSGKAASTAFVAAAVPVIKENQGHTATGHELVLVSAVGAGGGGQNDTGNATGGGAGGAIVNLPISLSSGDTIGFSYGTGGNGNTGSGAGAGTATVVTITRALSPSILVITLNGGAAGTTGGGAGGTVTSVQYDSNSGPLPAGHNVSFPAGITGSVGNAVTGTGPNRRTSGGASPFASGGIGSSSSGPITAITGTLGSGGGGGDGGSDGGAGYSCLVITARP